MPLYDFHCRRCGDDRTYLLKMGEIPRCEACGSDETEKLLAPISARVSGEGSGHVHGPGCGHAPSPRAAKPSDGCGAAHCAPESGGCANSYTKSVLDKYVP